MNERFNNADEIISEFELEDARTRIDQR
jgi:hypothetical protein